MRITVQIPKNAAQKLRDLAAEANSGFRNLGIRTVQLDGDSVISVNVGGANRQPCNSKHLGKTLII